MELVERTTSLRIDYTSGIIFIRKTKIFINNGEETIIENIDPSCMPSQRDIPRLQSLLEDRPLELSLILAHFWTPEYIAQKEAEEAAKNPSQGDA